MIMGKQITIFAENTEQAAMDQFMSAMGQDFSVSGALMPDVHKGYSLPIGAVVATKGVIVPAWVGYDIGCGMCALKLTGINKGDIKENGLAIFNSIYKEIPIGRKVNEIADSSCHLDGLTYEGLDGLTYEGRVIAVKKRYKHAMGSLGGGNHFIEIGYDEDDAIWVIIHSGSRGVGHGIASHYMTLASCNVEMLEKEFLDALVVATPNN